MENPRIPLGAAAYHDPVSPGDFEDFLEISAGSHITVGNDGDRKSLLHFGKRTDVIGNADWTFFLPSFPVFCYKMDIFENLDSL